MAWHDEWPHKVYASVLLLDGKIEGWKTGNPPKKEPGEFRAHWKRDRMSDYTVEYVGFEVNNDQEHNDAFRKLAPQWFRQWGLAEDLHGSPPYSDTADESRVMREKIRAMVPGPEMDEAVGKVIGAESEIMWCAMDRHGDGSYIDFKTESEANHWHERTIKNWPEHDYSFNGGRIVRKEIYKRYSEDISAAWEIYLKAMEGIFSQRKRFHMELQGLAVLGSGSVVAWPDVLCVLRNKMPESICKAALLSMEVPE